MSNIYNDKLEQVITTLGGTPDPDPAGNIYVARLDELISAAGAIGGGFTSWDNITDKPTTLSGYGITDAALASHTHAFSALTGKPTTLSGYGITDAPTKTGGGASGTWEININGTVYASKITGQIGMWTSINRPGPYRLYRRDNDSQYSVQTSWTGTHWLLQGYSYDTYHAGCRVAYADTAGSISADSWSNASLVNSWVNYGSPFANAGYWRDPLGVVHLRGLVKSGLVGQTMFTLPSGYRPSTNKLIVIISNGGIGFLNIFPTGAVVPTAPTSNVWASLEGVTFEV